MTLPNRHAIWWRNTYYNTRWQSKRKNKQVLHKLKLLHYRHCALCNAYSIMSVMFDICWITWIWKKSFIFTFGKQTLPEWKQTIFICSCNTQFKITKCFVENIVQNSIVGCKVWGYPLDVGGTFHSIIMLCSVKVIIQSDNIFILVCLCCECWWWSLHLLCEKK